MHGALMKYLIAGGGKGEGWKYFFTGKIGAAIGTGSWQNYVASVSRDRS